MISKYIDQGCVHLKSHKKFNLVQEKKRYHTCQALCILRIRKLLLWRTFSITDPSRRESGLSSGFTSSNPPLPLASSEQSLTFPELNSILSRCSWSRPSTLLCKLSGITTCENGAFKFQLFYKITIFCKYHGIKCLRKAPRS